MASETTTDTRATSQNVSVKSLGLTVLWLALVGGLLEVAVLAYRHAFTNPIMELSPDYVWMTPMAVLATTFAATAPFFAIRVIGKQAASTFLVLFASCTVVLVELLLFIPGVHHGAILVLALGVSIQLTRSLNAGFDKFTRLTKRTAPWLVLLVILLGAAARGERIISERRALAALPSTPPKAPNVILISLDTVRAASMSLYGYSRPTTPQLAELARRGVVFDHALSSAPWTLPSHATMFTGRWHHELSVDWTVPLNEDHPTLAEFLASRGYLTGGFVANMRYVGYESGLDRGFIHFEDYLISIGQIVSSSNLPRTVANNFRLRRFIENDQHINRKSAEHLNPAVLDWLSGVGERPFFLFINYFDAHEPYLPPPPFDEAFGPPRQKGKYSPLHRWLYEPALGHSNMGEAEIREEVDAYDGTLSYLDNKLGELLDEIEAQGQLDETLVIITADHGEEFGEHEVFEHGNSLYRASIEVPLVMRFPGVIPEGKRIATPASIHDLAATVVDVLGLEGSPFPGRSLARYWLGGESLDSDSPIFSTVHQVSGHPDWFPASKGDMHSLTIHGMRYIRNGDGVEELYDFNTDPWEQNNLAESAAHQSILEEARRIIGDIVTHVKDAD